MLKAEHFNQRKEDTNLEMNQKGDGKQSNKKITTIKDVVNMLNNDQELEQVANRLNMKVNVLTSKLANAAVELNQEGKWIYNGCNESESLARDIQRKTYVKSFDREYVRKDTKTVNAESKPYITDLAYELYKDSLSVENPSDKKSVLFEEHLYEELKAISKNKKIKVSNLINVLIYKGLEYYHLKN